MKLFWIAGLAGAVGTALPSSAWAHPGLVPHSHGDPARVAAAVAVILSLAFLYRWWRIGKRVSG